MYRVCGLTPRVVATAAYILPSFVRADLCTMDTASVVSQE
jgi:hypothetical protein